VKSGSESKCDGLAGAMLDLCGPGRPHSAARAQRVVDRTQHSAYRRRMRRGSGLGLLVLVSCGRLAADRTSNEAKDLNDAGAGGDSARSDAGDDSAVRDADVQALTTATVYLNNGSATGPADPAPGIHVYFQTSDSTLLADVVTDSAGRASAVLTPGGFVSVAFAGTGQTSGRTGCWTFAGVTPGQPLYFDKRGWVGSTSSSELPSTLDIALSDLPPAPLDSHNQPIAYYPIHIDPFIAGAVPLEIAWPSPYAITNTGATTTSQVPSTGVVGVFTTFGISFAGPSATTSYTATSALLDWMPAAASTTTYSVDALPALLHPLTSKPTYRPADHAVHWTEGPDGVAPQYAAVVLHPGQATSCSNWIVVGRVGGTTLELPILAGVLPSRSDLAGNDWQNGPAVDPLAVFFTLVAPPDVMAHNFFQAFCSGWELMTRGGQGRVLVEIFSWVGEDSICQDLY